MASLDVIYDDQCGICRDSLRWIRWIDRNRLVRFHGVHATDIGKLHPDLRFDECLREMHLVTPERRILKGWDAVARLARLSPATWMVGAVGSVPPFRWIGRWTYRLVARHRYAIKSSGCSISQKP